MFAMRSSFVSHHHNNNHLPTTTTTKRTRKTRKWCRSPSASNDDLNSNNIEHDDDDDEWQLRDVELNVQLVSPETTKNRRVITIQEQRHDDAVIPVMAKPPLAFLLGMFCAMPIALWEAKRKVRLDARIYGGLDGGSSPATDASRGPPPPKASPTRTGGEGGGTSASSSSSSSPSTTPAGPGKRALKASTVAALARVNPEMYLPTPKERSYGNQSMTTTTTTTGSNAASNEGIVERKGGRESKVAFSRLVDGARSVIASAGISSTLPTVVMEDIGEENEDVDSMRLNPINSNGTSSSNGSSSRTSRTLIAVKWNPPEHDPFATILVGGNIEQLGSWTPENCVHMKSIGGNKWIADLGHIAAATEINFKFVVESENFGRRAETGEVRNFDVPVLRGGETRFTYVARQAPRW